MKKDLLLGVVILAASIATIILFYVFFVDKPIDNKQKEENVPVKSVQNYDFEISLPQKKPETRPAEKKQGKCIGEFILTAYCPCAKCCGIWGENRDVDECGNPIVIGSIGKRLLQGRSIAVDPRVIPYGTEILIDGHVYVAEDCGGAIKGNRIDVFFNDHESALNFGRQTKVVYMEG